ncbi:MMPL family transporter [Aeromicrobium duanguangcaii]|uniref:MMPL family transporter n=1 Tax=Aeromicrobium duanguangcaii TaxID=2968086 RepID=A0ABY5KGC8_9ACTN|nr:MMPL family transporter [Aeromicrobium duanguangcaii]MCD9154043.1 MMPL family transporter [Aeromicrobium duanguangcaii]MCL3837778.1 MMPL family transporter [Aeromicrobium duanguangcaii]UUI68880.1 MMPL family transporter [Aeromicrobium duanguangcaii]
MSTLLYRWGKTAFAHPFRFLGVWLVLLVVIIGSIVLNAPKLSTEVTINGVPAQNVLEQLEDEMPAAAGGAGQIVYRAPDGASFFDPQLAGALAQSMDGIYDDEYVVNPAALAGSEQDQAAAQKQVAAQVKAAEQATAAVRAGRTLDQPVPLVVQDQLVPGVTISPKGDVAMAQFQFTKQTMDLPTGAIEETLDAAEEPLEGTGIEVLPGASLQEIPEVVGLGEVVGIVVAAVVLFLVLGSVVAAGLPLVTALLGVGVGVGGAYALGHFYELGSMSVVLGLMLGLAVGIDYALFIVNRQRRLIMRERLSAHEATGRAVGTAGSAVFFAGTTVVIALAALTVIGISLLTIMAIIAAATVAVAVAVALTALPALLGLVGERIVSDKARAKFAERESAGVDHATARRWVTFLSKNRFLAAGAVVVITLLMAIPATDMRLGLPSGENYNSGTDQRESYAAVTDSFGEGLNGPLLVVLSSRSDEPVDQRAAGAIVAELGEVKDVAAASPSGMSEDGRTVLVSLVPKGGPTDPSTETLVHELRDLKGDIASKYDVNLGITGQAAMGIDIAQKMSDVMPIYLAIVVVLSLIVLTIVFRSIIVPLKATAGFLLTILATLGATTAVFQWGWLNNLFGLDSTGPVMALLPILVTGIAYGLAMDYQVFLVSSMRESWVHGHGGRESVIDGFTHSSRVVVAAAVIMTAVFAGFIFNGDPMIKQIGFALAIAIAIDAFLVRMTLVPALMAMFGDRAWRLPAWLDRALPDLDIEGDQLLKSLGAKE